MPDIQPSQADFLRHFFATSLTSEHAVTRRVIDAVPPDKADYRPQEVVKSAFELAWHIVSAEHRFLAAVADGAFDYTSTRPETVRTIADVSSWYADAFARDIGRVRSLSTDALVKSIDFRGIVQFPAVVYLQIGLNHSIHHRGQLSMYLRPMGGTVPAIYGESYDTARQRSTV
jgi:uncharacterized damage-inducible protein DinB